MAHPAIPRGARHTGLLAALLLASACQSIAGIRDRHLASLDEGVSDECRQYCDQVHEKCQTHKAYRSLEACHAVCEALPRAGAGADGGVPLTNTLECRLENASTLIEPGQCEIAGPSGGSTCGTRCEAYCQLYRDVCDEYPAGSNDTDCRKACAALSNNGALDADESFAGGDTLQCRFAHLSVAAAEAHAGHETQRLMHCGHARVNVLDDKIEHERFGSHMQYCYDKDIASACSSYCTIVMKACVGALQQYDDSEQCKAICQQHLTAETEPDKLTTTLQCRLKKSYDALEMPSMESCLRAGPAGGGEGCASACSGYCGLLAETCGAAFSARYGSEEACTSDCSSHQNRYLNNCLADTRKAFDPRTAADPNVCSRALACRLDAQN